MGWTCSLLLAVCTACSAVFSCRTRRQTSLSINQEGGAGVHGHAPLDARRSCLESRRNHAGSRQGMHIDHAVKHTVSCLYAPRLGMARTVKVRTSRPPARGRAGTAITQR
jgi:hypothetical protein